jgi:hypothetical protein
MSIKLFSHVIQGSMLHLQGWALNLHGSVLIAHSPILDECGASEEIDNFTPCSVNPV